MSREHIYVANNVCTIQPRQVDQCLRTLPPPPRKKWGKRKKQERRTNTLYHGVKENFEYVLPSSSIAVYPKFTIASTSLPFKTFCNSTRRSGCQILMRIYVEDVQWNTKLLDLTHLGIQCVACGLQLSSEQQQMMLLPRSIPNH